MATATEHETKAPDYIGAAAGKYQWDDRTGSEADQTSKATLSTSTIGRRR